MAINTTGIKANSWIDLDDANLILMDIYHPDLWIKDESKPTDLGSPFQLEPDHLPHLVEAARTISALWQFPGQRTEALQTLAWPRKCVRVPGARPGANWFSETYPGLDPSQEAYARFLAFDAPGFLADTIYPTDAIPGEVKEAQAILAALFVQGVTVWEDNKGDNTNVQLGSIKIDNVNAVSRIMIVKERLARWGKFIGSHMSAAGGSRA